MSEVYPQVTEKSAERIFVRFKGAGLSHLRFGVYSNLWQLLIFQQLV